MKIMTEYYLIFQHESLFIGQYGNKKLINLIK